jgi:uncharacterized membrane protein YcfT
LSEDNDSYPPSTLSFYRTPYNEPESQQPLEDWFIVERRGRLKLSKFKLLVSLSAAVLKFKVNAQRRKAKYILNFELFAADLALHTNKIIIKPRGSHSVFSIEHEDSQVIAVWGAALETIINTTKEITQPARYVSRFRWWKVRPR